VVLGEGEKLVIEGFATLRTGKEHAKWQAGTLCGYKNLPSIEIIGCNGCGRCVKVCPRGVLVLDESDTLKVKDITECSLCRLCVEECEQRAISVMPLEDAFIMSIESDGSINAKDLVRMAAEELKKKALVLQDTLASIS
jgi:DNA-directed RNA polymerase, alpha subunit/40 kD subunit